MNLENFILGFFDFVGNIDFNIFGTALVVLLGLFWIVLIGWVWIDSGERTSNTSYRVIYLLLVVILNIPGLIIYFIIRPSETIEQIYWADLERRYLKYETAELGDCSKCGSQLLPGYIYCTNCGNEIKKKCPTCGVMIAKNVKFCAYCGTQVGSRAVKEEEYPSVEVMEQQILASKEEATDTVESKRLRYKQSGSFVVKLGNIVISNWKKLMEVVKSKTERTEEVREEKRVEKVAEKKVVSGKKKKKNKKKKKR
jgi:hypothetical protein